MIAFNEHNIELRRQMAYDFQYFRVKKSVNLEDFHSIMGSRTYSTVNSFHANDL